MTVPPSMGKERMYVTQVSCVFHEERLINYRVLQSQLAAQIFEQFLDLGGREGERGTQHSLEGQRGRPIFLAPEAQFVYCKLSCCTLYVHCCLVYSLSVFRPL